MRPQAYAPYRARTKGKDERGVGYAAALPVFARSITRELLGTARRAVNERRA